MLTLFVLVAYVTFAIGCPTSDKLDFRYKTEALWDKCSKAQIRQLTMANVDVIIAAMRLQAMKYRFFHGVELIDKFYSRLIDKAQKYIPVAWAVMDTYEPPPNISLTKHTGEIWFGGSFEGYRRLGHKLDVERKNQLIVTDPEHVLATRFAKLQNTVLSRIMWASRFIKEMRKDTLWSSLHIQIHDLVRHVFSELNAELDELPSGIVKAKTLQILIEDIGILLI